MTGEEVVKAVAWRLTEACSSAQALMSYADRARTLIGTALGLTPDELARAIELWRAEKAGSLADLLDKEATERAYAHFAPNPGVSNGD